METECNKPKIKLAVLLLGWQYCLQHLADSNIRVVAVTTTIRRDLRSNIRQAYHIVLKPLYQQAAESPLTHPHA